ncbi:acyltransferase [Flavobacterium sp.]|uniref:acyltransferase n=1 Tax=Flavobacterium sp. TaxID=239 RepID=UPI0034534EF9
MEKFIQKVFFIIRFRYRSVFLSWMRKCFYALLGMKIGKSTNLPKVYLNWPHQVSLGNNCVLESGINFKFDGIWKPGPAIVADDGVFIGNSCEFNISKGIRIGKNTMLASGCKFIDHDHGTSIKEMMNTQQPIVAPIVIEEEVWMGVNCVVLKGVTIGKGAVVAAGSVVIKDVEPYTIVGGIPAKFIKKRT